MEVYIYITISISTALSTLMLDMFRMYVKKLFVFTRYQYPYQHQSI